MKLSKHILLPVLPVVPVNKYGMEFLKVKKQNKELHD